MGVSDIELASPETFIQALGYPPAAVKERRSIGKPCPAVVWQDRFAHQLAIIDALDFAARMLGHVGGIGSASLKSGR